MLERLVALVVVALVLGALGVALHHEEPPATEPALVDAPSDPPADAAPSTAPPAKESPLVDLHVALPVGGHEKHHDGKRAHG